MTGNKAMEPNRIKGLALIALLCLPLAAPAADDADEDREIYRPYTTTQFYNVTPDFDNLDSAIAIGQTAGFPIPGVPGLAVELDLLVTLFGGDNSGGSGIFGAKNDCNILDPNDDSCHANGGGGGGSGNRTASSDDFFLFGYGLFASYSTPGKFFVMGKAGVNGFSTSIQEIEDEGGGFSWKAGVGYRYGPRTMVHLDYFRINDLVDGIGIGFRYGFDDVF